MNSKTRNYLLAGAGALVAAFIVDDRIKPLGLAKVNPLTIWRLRNVHQTQQTLMARASAPSLVAAPPTMPRYATTSAATISQQSAAARAMGL